MSVVAIKRTQNIGLTMEFLILFLISGPVRSVLACDRSELTAISDGGFQKVFIYAAEGFHNEIFDLKSLFHVLQFKNTSQTLPFIVSMRNNFSTGVRTIRCSEEPLLEPVTQIWVALPNITMNGIFYGCDVIFNAQMRIYFHDNASSSYDDVKCHCGKFQGVPTKLLSNMKSCMDDYKDYSQKCLYIAIEENFSGLFMIMAGILPLLAILFIAVTTYRHFKSASL